MTAPRHFLTLMDLAPDEIRTLIARAIELKTQHRAGTAPRSLEGKVLAMIFTKASTRTRVSFEAGMAQLGGSALFLSGQDTQLGRGEPIEDSARVISSMVDIVMIRTFAHADVEDFAAHSSVPVINGLTDDYHPLPNTGGSADLLRSKRRHQRAQGLLVRRRQQRLSLLDECGPTTRLRGGGGVPRGVRPGPRAADGVRSACAYRPRSRYRSRGRPPVSDGCLGVDGSGE